jgi:protein TonB
LFALPKKEKKVEERREIEVVFVRKASKKTKLTPKGKLHNEVIQPKSVKKKIAKKPQVTKNVVKNFIKKVENKPMKPKKISIPKKTIVKPVVKKETKKLNKKKEVKKPIIKKETKKPITEKRKETKKPIVKKKTTKKVEKKSEIKKPIVVEKPTVSTKISKLTDSEKVKTSKKETTSAKTIKLPTASSSVLTTEKSSKKGSLSTEGKKAPKKLTVASLKGKESVFDIGKSKKSKKNTDEDIEAYIRALNNYLNALARRKDLYPPLAKRLRLEGSLVIKFKVYKDGRIDESSIKVVIPSEYNTLNEGAVRIIKKYVPLFAKKYGKKPPRDIVVKLPVNFQIIGW